MPNRVPWNAGYCVGNETLDAQHRAILDQCNFLADCIVAADPENDLKFDRSLQQLMALAGEHFSTEAALLTQCAYPQLEEHKNEHDEFDYLANEIITTKNFEKVELQRFLSLWWLGHIVGTGKKYRSFLEKLRVA
jgi:hemerythrin-like metal-binding protein